MKDQVIFVLMLITLGWGFYKSWKTKNEALFCATLFCGSVFSIKYPFYVPIGFSISFIGFFGFGFLLYKILYQKLDKILIVPAMLLLASGIIFLLQGFHFLSAVNFGYRLNSALGLVCFWDSGFSYTKFCIIN